MAHLLNIDSSIQDYVSISRRLTARAVAVWRDAHPGSTVAYRDLGRAPMPHLDDVTGPVPRGRHTMAQATSWRLRERVVREVREADAIVLGMPLYNYGAPSSVKAWIDHLMTPGLAYDPETRANLLGKPEVIVIATRGGGYGPGSPREGQDHAQPWFAQVMANVGLETRFITAEFTAAENTPSMAKLIPMAAESFEAAENEIDQLWPSRPSGLFTSGGISELTDGQLAQLQQEVTAEVITRLFRSQVQSELPTFSEVHGKASV